MHCQRFASSEFQDAPLSVLSYSCLRREASNFRNSGRINNFLRTTHSSSEGEQSLNQNWVKSWQITSLRIAIEDICKNHMENYRPHLKELGRRNTALVPRTNIWGIITLEEEGGFTCCDESSAVRGLMWTETWGGKSRITMQSAP